jgi:hydrogenase expression/formation protein HypD
MQNYKQDLLRAIKFETRNISLMEVCGTHTMAIARSGIRELLPPETAIPAGTRHFRVVR